jgi:thiamine transport system permease protein
LLPPFLIGIAVANWTDSFEINALTGMLMILFSHTLMNAGFIARVVASKSLEQEQVEAAVLDGAGRWQIRRQIQIPQLLPSLASASLLVALYSSTSYGLILTLSAGTVETLETEIALAALRDLDLEKAGFLALLQTFLTLGLFFAAKQFAGVPTSMTEISRSSIPAGKVTSITSLLFVALIATLLTNVVSRANWGDGVFANIENLTSRGTRSMLNISVIEAAGNSIRNALVVLVISIPLAWVLSKKAARLSPLLPAGLSPVVIGLVTLSLAGYLPRELTSSWILLPLIQVLFALPIAYQILQPARSVIEREQVYAASLDGAGGFRTAWFIELPQLRKSVATASAFAVLTSLGEFGAASFLAFGSNETLPIVMFQLAGRPGGDNYGMVMASAAIYILLTAFILWLLTRPDRTERQDHPVA